MPYKFTGVYFSLVISAVATFTGCSDDDPLSSQESHFEAEGLVIVDSGIRFFRYFQGKIDTSGTNPGHLEAPLGLTNHWSIRFLDAGGNEIAPPDDPNSRFTWTIADPAILEVFQDKGDEGDFEFHLRGLKPGKTNITLEVTHVDHVDFRTIPIPVHVEAETGQHGEPIGVRVKDEKSGTVLAEAPVLGEGETTGSLAVARGDTTAHIEVEFFDVQDVGFQPAAPSHALSITVADTSLLAIEPPVAPEFWAFRLIGKQSGKTTITLSILHDGDTEESFATISVAIDSSTQ